VQTIKKERTLEELQEGQQLSIILEKKTQIRYFLTLEIFFKELLILIILVVS
jgi:hypothetical protein